MYPAISTDPTARSFSMSLPTCLPSDADAGPCPFPAGTATAPMQLAHAHSRNGLPCLHAGHLDIPTPRHTFKLHFKLGT